MRLPLILALVLSQAAIAGAAPLAPVTLTEWKSVHGRVDTRDRLPARARLGGTLVDLTVNEGDQVAEGQVLGRIVDEKLALQLQAIDAQLAALRAQIENAEAELVRGEDLLARGVTTAQRLDALRTQVDVLTGQLGAVTAQRSVVAQQTAEGAVVAPVAGRVLAVPLARGAVVMPGEPVVQLGGGGTFLRLAVAERHAAALDEGDTIRIEGLAGADEGRIARLYPLIENGRVIADVELPGLTDRFVDARVLVRLPVGTRAALMVPQTAVVTRHGLDFVETTTGTRLVVLGERHQIDGVAMVEVVTGLRAGDELAGAGQ
jgi:RND family efflux transporter MFP subunit